MNRKFWITLAAYLLASTTVFAADGSSESQTKEHGASSNAAPCQTGKMGKTEKTPATGSAENSGANIQTGKMGEQERTPNAASAANGC
jgi:hypothetical protein